MGELIEVGTGFQGMVGASSFVVSLVAIGMVALMSVEGENDDDDSTPGGGLMQPVA
jgi:poly-beta-hydroxyalkanoate depolymerase